MISITQIRNQLGMNQQEMAVRLGITRSLLAKAETDLCFLKTETILILLAFEKRLNEECSQKIENVPQGQSLQYCKNRRRDNKLSLHVLEDKLESMQKNLIVRELPDDLVGGSAHSKRVERRSNTCGTCAQALVKIKIDLLLRENKVLEEYIEKLSKECV